jgi:hypothetical protein
VNDVVRVTRAKTSAATAASPSTASEVRDAFDASFATAPAT